MNFLTFIRFGVLLLALFFIAGSLVSGQTPTNPEPIVTWRANTLFPSDYQGKAFPGPRSSVTVSVESYQSGKWLDLSRASIIWVLGGKVIGRGDGMKELSFKVSERPEPSLSLKVVITPSDIGSSYEAFSSIPVLGPQVVVNAPFPGGIVSPQSRFTLEALPYFWNTENINDILFSWTANTTKKSARGERAITLTVGTPSNEYEKELQVNALLQNPNEPTEFARDYAQLEIQ